MGTLQQGTAGAGITAIEPAWIFSSSTERSEAAGFPFVSVVVLGYNSRDDLPTCLDALLAQDYPGAYEVIFVDNASGDGSADYARAAFPAVRVIESGGNLGYAAGNNLGARAARGDVLAFVNPDTRAATDWLRELVRPLRDDPTVGLTTSKIVLLDRPEVINACGNDLSLTGVTTCRYAGRPAATVVDDEVVPAVSGAAFAIRAALFRELGGFDEDFWMYLEDTDLSWRARLAGFRCVLAARSVIAHAYSQRLAPAKTRRIEANRYRMLAKNLSGRALLTLLPQLVLGEVVTWGWAALRGPRFLWAKLLAVWAACRQWGAIRAARWRTQQLRRVPDGVVLRGHVPAPAITDVADGLVGRLAAGLLVPLHLALAGPALALLDGRRREAPDAMVEDDGLAWDAGGD